MSPTSKGNALKLASTAHDLGGEALRGTLEQNEAGHWTLSYVELESWLSRYAGQELVLAVAPSSLTPPRPTPVPAAPAAASTRARAARIVTRSAAVCGGEEP